MSRNFFLPILSPLFGLLFFCASGAATAAEVFCSDGGVVDSLMCDGQLVDCVGTDDNDTIIGTDGDDVIQALGGNEDRKSVVVGGGVCGSTSPASPPQTKPKEEREGIQIENI